MSQETQASGGESIIAHVGRWGITVIPPEWEFVPGFGIRHQDAGATPSNVCLTEDVLLAGNSLPPYLEVQKTLLRRMFTEPAIAGPTQVAFPQAEEAMLMLIKYAKSDGSAQVVQAQTYVRSGTWIGIATLTALESAMPQRKASYQAFLRGLRI